MGVGLQRVASTVSSEYDYPTVIRIHQVVEDVATPASLDFWVMLMSR